jgi:hypothetical protein
MSKTLQDRYATSPLFGGNAPYIEGLYEQYLEDPASVEPALKAWFDGIANGGRETPRGPVEREFAARALQPRAAQAAGAVPEAILDKQAAVLRLIEAYRLRGHRLAKLDPLGLGEPQPLAGTRSGVPRARPGGRRPGIRDRRLRRRGAPELPRYPRPARTGVPRHDRGGNRPHFGHRRAPLAAAPLRRGGGRRAARGRGSPPHPRAAHRRRGHRALPAHALRGPEALLAGRRREHDPAARRHHPAGRRPRHGGSRHRHGPSRPPQRAGQRAGQAAQGTVLGVRGQVRPAGAAALRRRQVPPGLLVGHPHARRPRPRRARLQSRRTWKSSTRW